SHNYQCARRQLPNRALGPPTHRSEEHTSELQSHLNLVCRLLLEKKTQKGSDGEAPMCAFILAAAGNLYGATAYSGKTVNGFFFFLMIRRPPRSTLFPSTPLFR